MVNTKIVKFNRENEKPDKRNIHTSYQPKRAKKSMDKLFLGDRENSDQRGRQKYTGNCRNEQEAEKDEKSKKYRIFKDRGDTYGRREEVSTQREIVV